MVNRTALSLDLAEYPDYVALQLQTGQLRRAYLGNERGIIPVASNGATSDHYGKVYIRFVSDLNENGATVLGQAVEAWVNPNTNYTYKTNLPVLVRIIGANSGYMVEQVDVIASAKANYNTHSLNPLSPENNQIWIRSIRDGRLFATATINTDSLTVSVEPFILFWEGAYYDGGQANNIDLTTYMPAAGYELLVLIGIRAWSRTVQILQSTPRIITSIKYALSDIAALTAEWDDYIIPIGAIKLADDAVTVLERDLHQDLRQFINVQQPRGFPINIVRHFLLLDNYRVSTTGTHTLAANGQLEFTGTGQLVSL